MAHTRLEEDEEEAQMGIKTQGYTIFHTVFGDKLTADLVVKFLEKDMKVTAGDIESQCGVSRSTAFRRLSELNKAGLLIYEWSVTSESPPKAVKVYSMPAHIREALRPLFKNLREALSSMLGKQH